MRPLLCHLSYAAAPVDRAENLQGYEDCVKLAEAVCGACVPESVPARRPGGPSPRQGDVNLHLSDAAVSRNPQEPLARHDLGTLAAWAMIRRAATTWKEWWARTGLNRRHQDCR